MINRENLLSGTRPEVGIRVLVTEKEGFEGYQVVDYKGVVWGISMRSKDIVQDIGVGCKQVTGGELSSYTELSEETRQKAWDKMISSARNMNANAVINFKFEISNGLSGNTEVVAYGNAVTIKPIKNYVPLGGLGNILVEFVDTYASDKIGVNGDSSENNLKSSTITIKDPGKKALITEKNGVKLAICPECQAKYNIAKDENGNVKVVGLTDVDKEEDGFQIYCIRCGTKLTIPQE